VDSQILDNRLVQLKCTKEDGTLQFYIFLHENIGHIKEAIIAAEQKLIKDKLMLENFN
jgi:hypothetical protein